jgi:hypothetical protein
LPTSRAVDWTLAGLRDTTTTGFQLVNMQTEGAIGDGFTANDVVLSNVLASLSGNGAILEFQNGNFLFNNSIILPNNIILKGQGVGNTTLTMDLGGSGSAIIIQGSSVSIDTTSLNQTASKDSLFIEVLNTANFAVGDWVQIIQQDTDLVTSSWAYNSVGQVVQIDNIVGNKIVLKSPLRMEYVLSRTPYIRKITPVKNVGIECLKIHRIDDTDPQQSSSIYLKYAVNCWVTGIESENCTFSHLEARNSSNILVSKSYFHHGFNYGGGGRGYGVMLHSTTNECLVEDNVFEHLRHSMIVQSGANGNVFSFNYSFDPFWDSTPNNSAGDMVLHGNYPYANLFEQNVCRNIVIDNSHGPNGPYNTFFRNRAEGYGIFFSASNSPDQNLIGNDIPNTSFPYNLANYSIQGTGHFIYGNNNKGTIDPIGTQVLQDSSYAYTVQPSFVPLMQWVGIGTPNTMGANDVPAFDRYNSGNLFSNSCNNITTTVKKGVNSEKNISLFPNPTTTNFMIESSKNIKKITIVNVFGQQIYTNSNLGLLHQIDSEKWNRGIYFITIDFFNNQSIVRKMVKE